MGTVTVQAHHEGDLIFYEVMRDLTFDPFDEPMELTVMSAWYDDDEQFKPTFDEMVAHFKDTVAGRSLLGSTQQMPTIGGG